LSIYINRYRLIFSATASKQPIITADIIIIGFRRFLILQFHGTEI